MEWLKIYTYHDNIWGIPLSSSRLIQAFTLIDVIILIIKLMKVKIQLFKNNYFIQIKIYYNNSDHLKIKTNSSSKENKWKNKQRKFK